ncbi:MAG TPA: hypothetical protein VJV78_22275 [Polyangiales bacterium]|nr:hypothetical protein [Polyangiales bacterium]
MQGLCRTGLVLLVACWLAACGGDDAADEGGAGTSSSESGGANAAGKGGSGAAGMAPASGGKGGASAANGGGAGKAGAAAASGGGSGGQSSAAGSSGAAGASGACNMACTKGMHCELVAVTCIRAPCPAQPMCVADASTSLSCDPRKILCKRAAPECPSMQVPSVDGSCYGPCVPVEQCPCSGPSECPDSDHYTCHMSAAHCGPYL